MKPELLYHCTKCDAQTLKWSGRCLSCGAWGTLTEEFVETDAKIQKKNPHAATMKSQSFAQHAQEARTQPSHIPSLDQVLGGGLVDGSVTLIAGEPGVGKSTLLAQVALANAQTGKRVIYVTGEESPAQIERRLRRLAPQIPETLLFLDSTNADLIASTIESEKPQLVIVDSVQSLSKDDISGEPGSVSQVKASAATLTEVAKHNHIPLILVGQVTKDGDIAGPRVLEHLVDTVLFLEGDHEHRYRILRALKHRFGPTDEVSLLQMTERGLEPVEDPSSELLRDRAMGISGSAISCLIEGHRPMLLEIQALVSPAGYGTPVRRATGVDNARLGMLLAVLARRGGVQALDKDVYANAAGGIDARDPSIDLALVVAIASAVKDAPLDPQVACFGEVGLAGELRPVGLPDLRLREFQRMGFTTIVVPPRQSAHAPKGLQIVEVKTVREALQFLKIIL